MLDPLVCVIGDQCIQAHAQDLVRDSKKIGILLTVCRADEVHIYFRMEAVGGIQISPLQFRGRVFN